MEQELQRLIDSPEFRQYHEALQARPFNLFDVLRNAEYEIPTQQLPCVAAPTGRESWNRERVLTWVSWVLARTSGQRQH